MKFLPALPSKTIMEASMDIGMERMRLAGVYAAMADGELEALAEASGTHSWWHDGVRAAA